MNNDIQPITMLDGHALNGRDTITGYTCRLLEWPEGSCGTRYWGTHVFLVPASFASESPPQISTLNVVIYTRSRNSDVPKPYFTTCAGGAPNVKRGDAFHRAFCKALNDGEKVFEYEDDAAQSWTVAFVPARTAADTVI